MPTLTGTLTGITGAALDLSRVRRVFVRAPAKRTSLAAQDRLVTTAPVRLDDVTGELSVQLEPGPAILIVETMDSTDVYELGVAEDMTLITEAVDEVAPNRSWVESQMVQMRTDTVTAAADALEAAIATGQDRAEIELLRQNLIDAANENAAPHLTEAALSSTYASSDLTVSVADPRFGAVCDWIPGTGGTDNTTAIRAAIAHARALGVGAVLVYPEGAGQGYYVSETIEHGAELSVDMRADIVHPGGAVTVRFGARATVTVGTARLNLRVRRATESDWTDPADLGMEVVNFTRCEINVLSVADFTVGCRFLGHGAGFAANRGQVGHVWSCQVGIDYRGLSDGTPGWCNSNHQTGGYFLNKNARNVGKPRYGVRFSGDYQNNGNVLDGAAFELKANDAGAAEVVVMLAEAGDFNHLLNIRHEQSGATVLKQVGVSRGNRVEAAMSFSGVDMLIDNSLADRDSGIAEKADRRALTRQQRVVWRADSLHKVACFYDGAVTTHVPGMMFWQSGQPAPQRVVGGIPIAATYLEIPATRAIGGYVSTRHVKRFRLSADVDAGYGGRWAIVAFNAAGDRITDAGAVRGSEATGVVPFGSFGGSFRPGADMNEPLGIGVSAEVDYMWVGIAGGTNPARLRSIEVGCGSDRPVTTWTTWIDRENVGTAPPSVGTWERGRRILHANPAPGSPQGWVCTTAGTPGTWTPMPNL